MVRQAVRIIALGSIIVTTGTACATKKFVKTQVDEVGTRVESLSQSLETTQQMTKENAQRITQVDAKSEQAGLWAKDAQNSAATAQQAANAAASKADAVATASKRLIYEVVISEDQGNFKFGSADLPDGVKARIDELVTQLKADPRGNFVEIEGHTDNKATRS